MPEEEEKAGKNFPLPMKRNLTRRERLKRSSDISRVCAGRQSVSCFGAKLLYAENSQNYNRIVCIPARKFGTAVRRNRVKRHIKELYRLEKHLLATGFDLVFVIYPGMEYDYCKRKQQVQTLLQKADLYA